MAVDSALAARLLALVDERQQELIDLVCRLIQFPTENPGGQSGPITDFIAGYLQQYGIGSERFVAPGEHHNLVARIGSPAAGPRCLVFSGHSDVVPAGDRKNWSFDPFCGEVRDGYILGRGTSDMKAGLGGVIFATALLKESGVKLPGELILAVVDEEETGGTHGAKWVLEQGYVKGTAALIAEPSSPYEPTIGQKGSAWMRITFTGRPAHGSLAPVEGQSAILKAALATVALQKLFDIPVTVPEDIQEAVAVSKDYIRRARNNPRAADLLDHVSVNVGVVRGGTKANIVADECVIEVDSRVPFGATPDQVTERARELLLAEGLSEGTDYSMEAMGFRGPANYTVPGEPVVQAVLRSVEQVRGGKATGVLQWASSDARHFRRAGIPVLQYGPAELSTIHGHNEKVKVADVVAAAKVYLLTALDYLMG
jgi:succinyl-diaminopimelate desuccinylase